MILDVQNLSLNYYYVVIGITLLTLGLLCILIKENNRIKPKQKQSYYITYLFVALAALAECFGVLLNGNQNVPTWVLRVVKCLDYILTPIAGAGLISQLQIKNVFRRVIQITIAINIVFQLISAFTGWMTNIDPLGYYTHGSLYLIYIIMYLFLIVMIVTEFILYGQRFKRQNKTSLYATVIFAIAGIMTQELSSGRFRIAYLSLAIGMTMLFIHTNEFAQLKTDESIQEQKIRNMLSQIQPHFIYNSLNAIQAIDGVPEKAQTAIIDFSKYLRENLDSLTGPDLVSLDKEIEHLKKYISLEKLRFGEKVNVDIDIKSSNFMMPALTLQMLVENAIKHGITKKYEGGHIKITIQEFENEFVVTVNDDGVGFDTEKELPSNHVGLNNIKKRLEYFVDGVLEIDSVINKGTTATIKIPKTSKTLINKNDKKLMGGGMENGYNASR